MVIIALLSACGGGPDGPAWISLGAGDTSYAELADGSEVDIVLGPQGGYMIALAVQAGGVVPGDDGDPADPDNPRITFRATRMATATTLGIITQQRGMTRVDDEMYEVTGSWLVFNASVDTAEYFDQMVEIDVELVDTDGRATADSVTVMLVAPPVEQSAALLDLDVDPRVVVGRTDHDAQHAASDVDGAQEQEVTRFGRDVCAGAEEALLERDVSHVAGVGVVDVHHGDGLAVTLERQRVVGADPRVVDSSDMEEHVPRERIGDRVAPLDERARTEQKVIAVGGLVAVLGHAKPALAVRRRLAALYVDAVPPRALQRGAGALFEQRRQITRRDHVVVARATRTRDQSNEHDMRAPPHDRAEPTPLPRRST